MAEPTRKRRKWDVTAVEGVPIGSPAASGSASAVIGAGASLSADKPGQAMNQDSIARAQQGAAAVLERINRVSKLFVYIPPPLLTPRDSLSKAEH